MYRLRWAFCQLETLRRCPSTDIRHALEGLPESLDETYERTLFRIQKEKREYAHRLFQCLAVAIRPLRLDELAEFLAIRFDSGQPPQYCADRQLEDAQYLVLSACSSMISVVDVDGSPVVQFSHFSVKEFLKSDRLANSTKDISRFHIGIHFAHTILAQASLTLLLHLSDRVDKNSIKLFPFARYAARHWVDHGQFGDVSLNIEDLMERLFDIEEPSFSTWIWIYDIDYPFRQHMFEDRPPRPEAVPLYYATLCGFHNLVEHLITDHPGDINAKGGAHGSAVNAALVKRRVKIALLLLEHGADVNILDASDYTPLGIASQSGRRDNVELLIEHHADVNLANLIMGDTPLFMAACQGELEIAGVLLRHGATVDFPNKTGWTPTKGASRYGHADIVRLLIQSGASVDFPDQDSWTPLIAASRYGHLRIVKDLLDHGAAINAQNNDLWTPLHVASANGHLDIVEYLLERHADVDKKCKNQQTPLDLAAEDGCLGVARSSSNLGQTSTHKIATVGLHYTKWRILGIWTS
jgi:ankyrin repeat protein